MKGFWFWLVLAVTLMTVAAAGLLGYAAYEGYSHPSTPSTAYRELSDAAMLEAEQFRALQTLIAVGGVMIAGLANLFGIVFGWRKDRREAREYKLRIAELEKRVSAA